MITEIDVKAILATAGLQPYKCAPTKFDGVWESRHYHPLGESIRHEYEREGFKVITFGTDYDYDSEQYTYIHFRLPDATEAAPVEETRIVEIPRADNHGDFLYSTMQVEIVWKCPVCGSPRGDVFRGISYDGSRRVAVDCWANPCGHIDRYASVRMEAEARANELNAANAAPVEAPQHPVLTAVLKRQHEHRNHWTGRNEGYWLQRLMQEVGELASSLADDHEDTPDHELEQIASIALNWLEMRARKASLRETNATLETQQE